VAHSRTAVGPPPAGVEAPDYEAPDTLLVDRPEQLRALGDDLRARIVILLREHAHSTTELAETLHLPKSTVAHHLKVLEHAGLVRVVRTRKVRALTERYYGRTARLFVFKSPDDPVGIRNVAAAALRTIADEMLPPSDGDRAAFAALRVRLTDADAARFERRLDKLTDDVRAADTTNGEPYAVAVALFRRAADA
jgi:DNA-binding transcriptional ArsR family regulator